MGISRRFDSGGVINDEVLGQFRSSWSWGLFLLALMNRRRIRQRRSRVAGRERQNGGGDSTEETRSQVFCFVATCTFVVGAGRRAHGDCHGRYGTRSSREGDRDVLPKFPGCVEEEISLILVPCSIIEEMELPLTYSSPRLLLDSVKGLQLRGDLPGSKPFRLHVPIKGKDEW